MSAEQMQKQIDSLQEQVTNLTNERDYLLGSLIGERATWLYEREINSKPYEEYMEEAKDGILADLAKLHELEPGETLDGS